MFVVPVKGDKVKTKDSGDEQVVSSFTSLKDEPAVYVKSSAEAPYIYFSDIIEINRVRVEYSTDSKVFDSLGPLRRKYNLPQPKDSIKVKLIKTSYNDETEDLPVTGLRLHSKKYGEGRGLLVITKEGQFSLSELLDVERVGFTEKFDSDRFRRYYFDYLSIGTKRKGSS